MGKTSLFVREYAAAIFSLLTILLTFTSYLLPIPRREVTFVMVLIPAIVALCMAGIIEGRPGVRALVVQLTRWRLQLKWVGVALGTALLMRLAISLAAIIFKLIPSFRLRPISLVDALLLALLFFAAAIPEELGWRGYALPRLLKGHPVWVASLMTGLMWGVVHLAMHLPGMPQAGLSGYLTVVQLVALSVLLTWFYVQGGRNILLTSLFHAAQGYLMIFNQGLGETQQVWLVTIICCCTAAVVLIVSRAMRVRIKWAGRGYQA